MIDFSKPVRFRGKHAAYIQYLSLERGQRREGGVNVFSRIMDAYMVSILVGLKYNRKSGLDDNDVYVRDYFGESSEDENKKISSSDINSETIHASQHLLNYIYRVVMLSENVRNLSDEEKIANAFKSENNLEKIDTNIELMNSFARGGLEILYERFQGLSKYSDEVLRLQLELFDELGGYEYEAENIKE
ncbi:MAG: hypothetical protein ACI4WG_04825 [Erysipelotrichaceae bacterium]